MNKAQHTTAIELVNKLIDMHDSMREFARLISEDPADVLRWKKGRKVKPRAVITINKLYKVPPHLLRPDLFPKNLIFVFEKEGK